MKLHQDHSQLVIRTLSYLQEYVEQITEWTDKSVLAMTYTYDHASVFDLNIFEKVTQVTVIADKNNISFMKEIVEEKKLSDKVVIVNIETCSINGSFDTILFYSSLHDADDPIKALEFTSNRLKADGSLIIFDALLPGEVRDIYQALISGKKYLTYHELMSALRAGGFVIDKYQPIYFKRPIDRSLEHVCDERKKDTEKFILNSKAIKSHMGLINDSNRWFYFFDLIALLAKKGNPEIVAQD